jgi:hypothetical protein
VVFVNSTFELDGVEPIRTRYSLAPLDADHVSVTREPITSAESPVGAPGRPQDPEPPEVPPAVLDGDVGEPSSPLLPQATLAAVATAIAKTMNRFIALPPAAPRARRMPRTDGYAARCNLATDLETPRPPRVTDSRSEGAIRNRTLDAAA